MKSSYLFFAIFRISSDADQQENKKLQVSATLFATQQKKKDFCYFFSSMNRSAVKIV